MNPIPPTLSELLIKLDVVGALGEGHKLCVESLSYVSAYSWYGAIYRSYYGEGRTRTLTFLNNLVSQTIQAMNEYYGTEFFGLIIEALTKAKAGINNLISTYNIDPATASTLKLIRDNIQIQLNLRAPRDVQTDSNTNHPNRDDVPEVEVQ